MYELLLVFQGNGGGVGAVKMVNILCFCGKARDNL